MLDFRNVPTHLHGLAVVIIASAAAYITMRSSRQTRTATLQIAAAVDDLTLQAKRVDYWTIYRHVQTDLLMDDQDGD